METNDWIFYLQLGPKITSNYLILDNALKQRGKSLVPMSITDLAKLNLNKSKITIICTIESLTDRIAFMQNIKLINLFVRSDDVTIYFLSSFSNLSSMLDQKRRNFIFAALPVSTSRLCDTIEFNIIQKNHSSYKWPGGTNPRRTFEEL